MAASDVGSVRCSQSALQFVVYASCLWIWNLLCNDHATFLLHKLYVDRAIRSCSIPKVSRNCEPSMNHTIAEQIRIITTRSATPTSRSSRVGGCHWSGDCLRCLMVHDRRAFLTIAWTPSGLQRQTSKVVRFGTEVLYLPFPAK